VQILILNSFYQKKGGIVLKKLLLTLLAVSVISGSIFASGFQINESGAKAMSMAGAFTGVANDASAVFFNPAAMTFLDGTQIMAGVALISPSSSFRGVAPAIDEYKMEEKLFTPINFFVTHKFSDDFAMGISVNNPYGLGSTWPNDWVGKYLAVETEVRTFFANISIAYKIVDELSIAIGGSYAYGDVTISKYSSLAPFNADAFIELKGDATSYGFNAAIFWHPIDRIRLGATFRSESTFDFTGDGTADYPSQFEGKIPTGNISASLTTPMNLTFGGSIKAAENFMFSFDWQWVGWSS
jgi:long-chain fatty acid transport protein